MLLGAKLGIEDGPALGSKLRVDVGNKEGVSDAMLLGAKLGSSLKLFDGIIEITMDGMLLGLELG